MADACRQRNIPIRIGVNGGSLEKDILAKYGKVCPEAMVESAFGHIRLLNRFDFDDICVSLKSSSVPTTMKAYQLMSLKSDYPLHIGVTEAGTVRMGTLKSVSYTHLDVYKRQVLAQHLKVMDSTATSLSMDNKIPVLLFALKDPENILRVVMGEKIGTIVGG